MDTPKVILLVEDELPVRKFVSETLQKSNYKVISASSGSDAIAAFNTSRERVDLLLTDVDLSGGMTGIELAETLVAMRPSLRILLMSGSLKASLAFDDNIHCIRKPFVPVNLLKHVRDVLSLDTGLHFRRDCKWVQHLLSTRYPGLRVQCEQQDGNQYQLRLGLAAGQTMREVQFNVKEFADGTWEEKVTGALNQLKAAANG